MLERFEKYFDEWKVVGSFPSGWGPEASDPKRNFPISEKANLELVLAHKKPMYMATMMGMTAFSPRLVVDNAVRAWVIENDPILPGADIEGGEDMFGVFWEYVPITGGSMVRPGNPKIPDITRWEDFIAFPDLDSWDWEGSSAANEKFFSEDRMMRVWLMNGLNERIISLMDFTNVMIAYVDEDMKPGVHRFFDALCDFYDDLIARFRQYYHADVLMFNDDWGTQRGPQFSIDTAREMLVPYIRRIVESCHKNNMYFELHCCGKNDMIAPAFAEAGVDLWVPQEDVNDFDLLYRLIGDKVLLGMLLENDPEMSDEELFSLAEQYVDKYGKSGFVLFHGGFVPNDRLSEYIYYLSREAYDE